MYQKGTLLVICPCALRNLEQNNGHVPSIFRVLNCIFLADRTSQLVVHSLILSYVQNLNTFLVVPAISLCFSAKISLKRYSYLLPSQFPIYFSRTKLGLFGGLNLSNNFFKYIILFSVPKKTLLVILPACPPLFSATVTPKLFSLLPPSSYQKHDARTSTMG